MKDLIRNHKPEIVLVILSLVLVHLPLVSSTYWGEPLIGSPLNPATAGVFGDFIGGYIGTIFLIVSVGVLAATFRNQRATNQQTSFDSRFFELLRYHRENVHEIKVDELEGRRAFVSFIREWRMALAIVRATDEYLNSDFSDIDRAIIAFLSFVYGIGPNSTRLLTSALNKAFPTLPPTFMGELERRMKIDRNFYKSIKKDFDSIEAEKYYSMGCGSVLGKNIQRLKYIPFDGHQSRLEHHYRHLYHVVKYAVDNAPLGKAQTEECVKLVCAQLSTHEQALLALYSKSMGGAWRDDDYVEEFHMIENMPRDFFHANEFPIGVAFPKNYKQMKA